MKNYVDSVVSVCFKHDVVVSTLYPSTLLHGPCFACFVVGVLIVRAT
jgi:hypothetical protein